ncbi:degringolade isoform X2 [Haematobia irritans]|uniref:degringolade isoform X2 n=1 Tax=Haematobia irritans TaxID=7368 RepID=UPI003F500BF7
MKTRTQVKKMSSNVEVPIERTVEEALENVTEFIDSVYRDLSMLSPTLSQSSSRSQRIARRSTEVTPLASPESPAIAAGGSRSQDIDSYDTFAEHVKPFSSPRRRNQDDSIIEKINRICDSVDQNLRAVGIVINPERSQSTNCTNDNRNIPMPSTNGTSSNRRQPRGLTTSRTDTDINDAIIFSTPTETPSRNLFQYSIQNRNPTNNNVTQNSRPIPNEIVLDDDEDDDVVVVQSNLPPVIDLCTPNEGHRRLTINRNDLTRRHLETPVGVEVEEIPVRRRRLSKSKSKEDLPNVATNSPSPSKSQSENSSLDNTPFMCPVCMESCLKRRPTTTKCGHIYCEECIRHAIRLTHKCPMCKTKLSSSSLIRIYV